MESAPIRASAGVDGDGQRSEGHAAGAGQGAGGFDARLAALALRHRRIAVLVASGAADAAIAGECGVEAAAVGRLRSSPAFRELVSRVVK